MPGSKKKTILIQLDADDQPSAFDRVVAIDAGVDEVFSYSGVTIDQVQALVHGAIFTRGGKSLRRTAIFVGGTDVGTGEQMLEQALTELGLSARAHDKILRVARTIADLAGEPNLLADHVTEAIMYRRLDRRL